MKIAGKIHFEPKKTKNKKESQKHPETTSERPSKTKTRILWRAKLYLSSKASNFVEWYDFLYL